MIPYFLAHYLPIVDKIFVFDNGSTDRSLDMLSGDDRIVVEGVTTKGASFMDTYNALMNTAWKRSRDEAEWIVTAEMDEHLHHPDLRGYLARSRHVGVTFITALGYNMIADAFPTDPRPLWRHVVRGVRETAYDKPAIFDPRAVTEINYDNGRHAASPSGHIVHEPQRQVKLLHYKSLGLDYVCARNEAMAVGLQSDDIAARHGAHYLRDRSHTEADLEAIRAYARRVPGLRIPGDAGDELSFPEEADRIAVSGLFDAGFYMKANPDVASSSLDPLTHYCAYGWREGRRPNARFDPAWYRTTYASEIQAGVNPLLDYILAGEARGRFPCVDFDPELYRLGKRLPSGVSPLLHFLSGTRSNGSLAEPNPPQPARPTMIDPTPVIVSAQMGHPGEELLLAEESDPGEEGGLGGVSDPGEVSDLGEVSDPGERIASAPAMDSEQRIDSPEKADAAGDHVSGL